jgi:trimeric autotransporter adhesin
LEFRWGSGRFGGAVEGSRAMHKNTIRLAAVAIFVIGLIAPAIWAQNTVQTIAGGGPNNLPALKSSLGYPAAVASDGAANVYVVDLYSERVLRVAATGVVTVVAGTGGRGGPLGDGGPAINANFYYPTGVAVDSGGNIFIVDKTYCVIQEISAQTGIISTVAGTGTCFYSGDGGPATSATLNGPSGVAVDKFENIFIADSNNCLIRMVSASTGLISTLAGLPPALTGLLSCGYSGDGGLATSAKVGFANGVAVDGSGNVVIADTTNCAIRKISSSTGVISTVAGTGSCGYSGDGGLATSAQLSQAYGVAVDRYGNTFIADTVNCLIREVSASNVHISTVTGNYSLGCGYSGDGTSATSAQLNQPYGVAVDSSGDIFIADYNNSVIREVSASAGSISTFAGVAVPDPNQKGQTIGLPQYSGDGYLATDAEIGFLNNTPYVGGLATDRSGNVFTADTVNSAVREISASTGIITTIAGNGIAGYSGDGGPAASAQLFYPRDVAVDGSGNIFIMDTGNCVVRKITASTGVISTVAGTPPDSAGNYYCDFSGDGGPATSAQLYPIDLLTPGGGVAVDGSGNIFIADTGNGVIREVSASTGIITTVVGIGGLSFVGFSGDGGPATSALMNAPYGVAVDGSGNIFIADTYNRVIREVTAANGNIYTVVGNADLGVDFSGDVGPSSVQLGYVFGVFLDPAGNLFIPDPDGCAIREVSGSTGIISTVAGLAHSLGNPYCGYSGDGGPALSAIFDYPGAAAAGASGKLVVRDNIRIRTVADLVQGPAPAAVPFPNPLVFPSEAVETSNTLTVILSDRGSLPTGVSTVAISGANASDFSETDNCAGRSLAAGGSCAINVKFTASVAGTESAQLTMTDTAGSQSVGLIGTGVFAPLFSPSVPTIIFGNQQTTVKSSAKSVTVTNNGTAGLTINEVGVFGPNGSDFAISADTCGATVAVNATCSVSVTFMPSTAAAETGSLQFTNNAPGSPQTIGLTGIGTDFTIGLSPGGSATASVPAGSPATYNLQVTPISGFNGTVALSCSGAPPESNCMVSEALVIPNGNTAATFSVQVTTTASSIASPGVGRHWEPFEGLRILSMVFTVALASAMLAFASRFRGAVEQRRHAYAFDIPLGFLLLAIILSGCGGSGGGSSGGSSGGTPNGTYTLTITGTSNGVSHSQTITLTVN